MNLYSTFYRQIRELAARAFPSLAELPEISWDHLISPYSLELPVSVLERVHKSVIAFHGLSRRASYQTALNLNILNPDSIRNESVLMAYDFHIDGDGDPRLVEINTNASSFLLGVLMSAAHESQEPLSSPLLADLRRSFEEEMEPLRSPQIAIVDDDLPAQRMYLEFLMYRDLFKHWGWSATIGEAKDLRFKDGLYLAEKKIDFVYNRSTDFFLADAAHSALREAWNRGAAVVSPQPREYFLLADKQRLIDFSRPGWLESAGATAAEISTLKSVLIPSYDKSDFKGVDDLWAKRKTLFFKPKHAYGGKSVYRGESVSRKVFDRLMSEDILIQKYVPAAPYPAGNSSDPMSHWKYDVRFYVYRDRIQQVTARIYQGQVTNFATPFGGFTRIKFR